MYPQFSLESRLEELAKQVAQLARRMDELAAEHERISASRPEVRPLVAAGVLPAPTPEDLPREYTTAALLSSTAIVCFLLAIALVLRTVVDGGVIGYTVGSALGVSYGTLLIAYGHFRHTKAHRLTTLYASCGALLVFSVLIETHQRFHVMPLNIAFAILASTLVILAAAGIHHRAPSLIGMGVLGACLTGMTLDFPEWHFPWLLLIVALANFAAYRAAARPAWRWLPWTVFLPTACVWFVWTVKLRIFLQRGPVLDAHLAPDWFLPLLALFLAGYLLLVLRVAFGQHRRFGGFEAMLPTAAGAGAFAAAYTHVTTGEGSAFWLGMAALLLCSFLLALALQTTRRADRALITGAFLAAAGTVFLLGLFSCSPAPEFMVVAGALGALVLEATGTARKAAAFRLGAGLLQLITGVLALVFGVALHLTGGTSAQLAAVSLLAFLSFAQYQWRRSHAPEAASGFYQWLDPADRGAVALLVLAVLYAFTAVMLGIDRLVGISVFPSGCTYTCVQSVVINLGAIALGGWGLSRLRGEVLLLAVAVAAVGAVKVFAYDLIHCQGVPLVLSVASFGLAAAVGSLLWNRWQHKTAGQ
ncbi:MAG: DUF2339 domain-containing protein [Candidatus Hydrogenedentes bacterium]|nr:DUF2339 domain-containing protein [Candidatus Hydrogenedentota bacterium]